MALPPLLAHGRGRGLGAVALMMLVQGTAAGAAAFATRHLFETMHAGGPLPAMALAVLVLAGIIIGATRIGARYLGERTGQDYASRLRLALFDHAARQPVSAVQRRRAGYLALRFVGDLSAFRNWLARGLPQLVAAAVLIPVMLAVLWVLAPSFVLAVSPVYVLAVVGIGLGGLRLIPLQRDLRLRRGRIAADMTERMPLAPALDRMGRRPGELARLRKRSKAMIRAALRHRLLADVLQSLPDVAAGLAAALIIYTGHANQTGTGTIAGGLAVLGLLIAPLRDLGGVWQYRAAYLAASVKAQALLAQPARDLYRAGRSLPKGAADLAICDLALPSGLVLTCHLQAGTTTDLAIPETDAQMLADILLGLEPPATGQINVAGITLQDLSKGTLRRNVQLIDDTPVLLQGSLRCNLLMGCDVPCDDARLTGLLRKVGQDALLARIGGLDGRVAENGKNLSPRERLAIACIRTALLRPKLLVLAPDIATGKLLRNLGLATAGRCTILRLQRQQKMDQAA